MPEVHALERRRDLLADKLKDRMSKVTQYIVSPKPYGRTKMSEDDQVRKFVEMRDTGGLVDLRSQIGDEEVDKYVRSMKGRASKYIGMLNERSIENAKKEISPEEVRDEFTGQSGVPKATYYSADDDLDYF